MFISTTYQELTRNSLKTVVSASASSSSTPWTEREWYETRKIPRVLI